MLRFRLISSIVFSLSVLSLAGCSGLQLSSAKSTQTISAPQAGPTINPDEGYPSTGTPIPVNNDPGYPAPESENYSSEYPDEITIPPLKNELGIVTGRLVANSDRTDPYLATSIYLGKAIEANLTDYPPLISLDTTSDPLAVQAKNGDFIFSDVEPGIYGLIIWSPFSQTVIQNPDKDGFPLLVEVMPGKIKNLGVIVLP